MYSVVADIYKDPCNREHMSEGGIYAVLTDFLRGGSYSSLRLPGRHYLRVSFYSHLGSPEPLTTLTMKEYDEFCINPALLVHLWVLSNA